MQDTTSFKGGIWDENTTGKKQDGKMSPILLVVEMQESIIKNYSGTPLYSHPLIQSPCHLYGDIILA